MAARLRPHHQEEVRAKIKTSQLINRLTDHALGKVEMSATQVTAAATLIRKTLPDLSAVELSGEVENRTSYNLKALDDTELSAVEAALAKAAVAGGSESGAGEPEAHSLH